MTRAFDSYLHCGLSKYRPIEEVLEVHRAAGVVGGILVQHRGEYDNAYIISAAERAGSTYRAVVLIDQNRPDWRQSLSNLKSRIVVAGLRVRAARDEERWVDVAEAAASVGMTVVYYLPDGVGGVADDLERLARSYRDVPFILTHLGTPKFDIVDDPDFGRLANLENIVLQVSGFCTRSRPPYAETVDCVRNLMRAFGSARVIWGSNFPVCNVEVELSHVTADPWGIGSNHLEALLYSNAMALWGLS